MPSDFYQPIIAATFGTVTHANQRLQASDVDNATLDALRITTDRLWSEYPYLPSGQLAAEGRQWLKRVAGLQSQRLTLAQHREVLTLSGWLALLIGCVEYDMGDRAAAQSTRRGALSSAREADNPEISGWAHEMRAWLAPSGRTRSGPRTLPAVDLSGSSSLARSPVQAGPARLIPRRAAGSEFPTAPAIAGSLSNERKPLPRFVSGGIPQEGRGPDEPPCEPGAHQ